jgi:type II secretory pathway predicted ATPase ExeA
MRDHINLILRGADAKARPLQNTPDAIGRAFAATGDARGNKRRLLILGEPGSGKTILLLQLAQYLLDKAENDPAAPVPVVVNLATWANNRTSIADWLIDELQRTPYGASRQYADELVHGTNRQSPVFLLDGLDEVADDHRDECVQKLNDFLKGLTPQVVITSRLDAFNKLKDRLDMEQAIEMQPPSPDEFRDYLRPHIKDSIVQDIMQTLQRSDELWHEVNKPLFINMLISTYKGEGGAVRFRGFEDTRTPDDAKEQLYKLVIEPYVTHHLSRRITTYTTDKAASITPPPPEAIRQTLEWVGWHLNRKSKQAFYSEMLQRDWLLTNRWKRLNYWLSVLAVGLAVGLAGGLAVGLAGGLAGGLAYGLAFGLAYGLAVGLASGLVGEVGRHFILRYCLMREQNAPFFYAPALFHARERRLLRKVGGSFRFIHRYVQDYFADRYELPVTPDVELPETEEKTVAITQPENTSIKPPQAD